MISAEYCFRVILSPEDGEYLGLCAEFSSLSWLSKNSESALAGIRKLVNEVVSDMHANGEVTTSLQV